GWDAAACACPGAGGGNWTVGAKGALRSVAGSSPWPFVPEGTFRSSGKFTKRSLRLQQTSGSASPALHLAPRQFLLQGRSLGRKLVPALFFVNFARLQNNGRELRVVHRVRKVLCLQAHRAAKAVR